MSVVCQQLQVNTDEKGNSWGLRRAGDEFLTWYEDTSGNPVILKDGEFWYADWDSTAMTFIPREPLTKETRKLTLAAGGTVYKRPTKTDYRKVRFKPFQKAVLGVGEDGKLSVQSQLQNPTAMSLSDTPKGLGASYTRPASGTIVRPIVIIYVTYQDSASFGTELTDAELDDMFFNKSKFGTLAHYYNTQFGDAVELQKVGIYRVTLPRSSKGTRTVNGKTVWSEDYTPDAVNGSSLDFLYSDMIAPALNGIKAQGFDFSQYVHTAAEFEWKDALTLSAGSTTIVPTVKAKYIDRSSLTPIIIVHGAENANYPAKSTPGTSSPVGVPRVHGMANATGIAIAIKDDGTIYPLADVSNDVVNYVNNNTTGSDLVARVDEALKRWPYVIKNWGIFGAYHWGGSASDPQWMFTLGLVAHECGHGLFDLPDLYDVSTPDRTGNTSDDEINGFGTWSLMAYNWTCTAGQHSGETPPNLDGYSIYDFHKRFAVPIFKNGAQTVADPFHPHVIQMDGVTEEAFILQPRDFTGYDAGIAYTAPKLAGGNSGWNFTPGALIMHYNPGGSNPYGNVSASDMIAWIVEAHGGTQNLRVDRRNSASNFGDPNDLFRAGGVDAFGDSVADPANTLVYEKVGQKGGFDITNIAVGSNGAGTYDLVYNTNEPSDPNWDSLPDDPEKPESGNTSDDDDPTDPTDPSDPSDNKPTSIATSLCCDRPRCWRFREARVAVPDDPVIV